MLLTESPSRTPPLEVDELLARCVGNIGFMQRVLERFIGCFGQDIERLEHCFQSQEPDELARIAHTMKGAAANVSAPGLQHQIAGIEDMAKRRELDEFSWRVAQLREEWSRVAASIATLGSPHRPESRI